MAEEKKVIQFQIVEPEIREIHLYLKRAAGIKERIASLNKGLIEVMMASSTAFRSARREAQGRGNIPEDVDIPELFDIRTGKQQVDIEGSIATYRIPPEPKSTTIAAALVSPPLSVLVPSIAVTTQVIKGKDKQEEVIEENEEIDEL